MSALVKYGPNGFSYHVLEECQLENLNVKETYWVKQKDSFRNGYNMTPGGDCREGVTIDDTTRKKLSDLGKKNVGKRNYMFGKRFITNGKRLTSIISKTDPIPDGWRAGRYVTKATCDKIRVKRASQVISKESYKLRGERTRNTVWITDGNRNRRVDPTTELPTGWRRGKSGRCGPRHHTEETKKKIREARARQVITDGAREKLRQKTAELWKQRYAGLKPIPNTRPSLPSTNTDGI
jgi:group I intron endonuclease